MRVLSSSYLLSLLVVLLLPSGLAAQTSPQNEKSNPLSVAEYGKILDRIEADLRVWEPAMRKIDPGKGDTSYKVGTDIVKNRDLGLLSIQNSLNFIGQQRTKRTVYGEIALADFLDSLNGDFLQLSLLGAFNDVSVEKMSDFGAEMGEAQMVLRNDGMRRLRILENSSCSH